MRTIIAHSKTKEESATEVALSCYGVNAYPSFCRAARWYPHTHVQALTQEAYELFQRDPETFDGYGKREDIVRLKRLFPNPLAWVQVA